MRLAGALRSLRDAAHLLLLDWASGRTRRYWETTRGLIRTMEFRAHAKIRAVTLGVYLRELGTGAEEVVLPDPTIETDAVGDPTYLHAIGALARASQAKRALEIGTYLGVGTLTIALNTAPDTQVVTVDLPDDSISPTVATLDRHDASLVQRSRGRVGQAFRGHSAAARITQVLANSATLDPRDYLPSAEFVLIDGGHTYDLIKSDTEKALSVLSPRGIVLWDDYWWFYPDVVRYLNELSASLPLNRIEGTNLVVLTRGFG